MVRLPVDSVLFILNSGKYGTADSVIMIELTKSLINGTMYYSMVRKGRYNAM